MSNVWRSNNWNRCLTRRLYTYLQQFRFSEFLSFIFAKNIFYGTFLAGNNNFKMSKAFLQWWINSYFPETSTPKYHNELNHETSNCPTWKNSMITSCSRYLKSLKNNNKRKELLSVLTKPLLWNDCDLIGHFLP